MIAVSTALGREPLVAAAVQALAAGRRLGFHGPCGIGKSTLLRHVALVAGSRLGRPGLYLAVAPDEEPWELTQRLAQQIGSPQPYVRLTRSDCARILATTRPVVALDIESWSGGRLESALTLLSDCRVVLGSEAPCLGPEDLSWPLLGLADDDALTLLQRDLGRTLGLREASAARRLVVAVQGHPLRLRQAAAVMRRGGHTWEDLAGAVERNPVALTRLSLHGLSAIDRRVFGTLAAIGGAFLSADLVDVVSDSGKVQQALEKLRGRRLVEVDGDRFGLPDCRLGGERDFYLRMLDLGSASKAIVSWLARQDPAAADTLDMATAVVKLIQIAAERRQWREVVALLEVVEPILTLAGRWETGKRLLDLGISAAQHAGDLHAEAFFHHQHGMLNLCEGEVDGARQHLTEALRQHRLSGEHSAAETLRHTLRMLAPLPATAAPRLPGPAQPAALRRRVLTALSALVAAVVLAVGLAGVVRGDDQDVSSPSVDQTPAQSPGPSLPTTSPIPGTPKTDPATPGPENSTTTVPPLTLTPSSVTFPDQQVGPRFARRPTARSTQQLTLTNHSRDTITIDGVAAGQKAFRIDADECATVAADDSCTVTVTFVPPEIGAYSSALTISPNGLTKLRTSVSGTGFAMLTITFDSSSVKAVTDGTGAVACTARCEVKLTQSKQQALDLTADVCQGCEALWRDCDGPSRATCHVAMTGNRGITVGARDTTTPVE